MPPTLLAKLERHIAGNHRHLRSLLGRKCTCKSCQHADTGREGIGSSHGTIRYYEPAVGTWLPVS